jgi:hypothetical protein
MYGPQLRQLSAVPLGRPGYGPQGTYPGGNYPGGYQQGYPAPPQGPVPYNTPGNYGDDEENGPPAGPGYGNDPRPNGSYSAPAPGYPGAYPPSPAPNAPGNDGGYYPDPANGSSYLRPLAPADVQDLTEAAARSTMRAYPS